MPWRNGSPRQSPGQAGPHRQGPGSGQGMSGGGQSQEQGAGSPDWLVNAVGTLVIALGSVVFRAFARKIKSYRAKDPEIGGNENQ